MAVASIQNTFFNSVTAPPDDRVPVRTLGQQDFLKLLVAQLTTQDPLNPTKDTEFIAQMASFSALEQSKSMQQDMAQMQASSLLGRSVTVKKEERGVESLVDGVVSGVQVKMGKPQVVIDGQAYDLDQVVKIAETPPAPPPVDTTAPLLIEQSRATQLNIAQLQAQSLLGRSVEIRQPDDSRLSGVVTAVQVKAGTPQIVVNGQAFDLSQVLAVAHLPSQEK